MINISKTKKKTSKPSGKKKDAKMSSFEEMQERFKVAHQKFRVVNMRKPFPRNEDGSIKAMSGQEVIDHCQGFMPCGQIMNMQFALDPDKASYKRAPRIKKAKIRTSAKKK